MNLHIPHQNPCGLPDVAANISRSLTISEPDQKHKPNLQPNPDYSPKKIEEIRIPHHRRGGLPAFLRPRSLSFASAVHRLNERTNNENYMKRRKEIQLNFRIAREVSTI